jgi:hypothetical protein
MRNKVYNKGHKEINMTFFRLAFLAVLLCASAQAFAATDATSGSTTFDPGQTPSYVRPVDPVCTEKEGEERCTLFQGNKNAADFSAGVYAPDSAPDTKPSTTWTDNAPPAATWGSNGQ